MCIYTYTHTHTNKHTGKNPGAHSHKHMHTRYINKDTDSYTNIHIDKTKTDIQKLATKAQTKMLATTSNCQLGLSKAN